MPTSALSTVGDDEDESRRAFNELRERASVLRASIGEAFHKIQRGHPDQVIGILENAAADFDRTWLFIPSPLAGEG